MSSSEKDYGDEQLAARILLIRSGLGLSMEAFAALLGVSQPTQSRIERAKRLPDALYLRRLRERLQVDINELLTGGGEAAQLHPSVTVNGNHNIVAGRDVVGMPPKTAKAAKTTPRGRKAGGGA